MFRTPKEIDYVVNIPTKQSQQKWDYKCISIKKIQILNFHF